MSAKNAENPVTPIRPICLIHPLTGTSRRVFLGERKWVSITRQEIAAQAGGNARPHDTQVQDKDKKVIPQHVEHAPGQDRAGGQGRPPIVAEKGRQHLGKEEGHRELHRVQIIPRQRDQRLVPAEEAQQGDLKED